jgi:hypothetical protein
VVLSLAAKVSLFWRGGGPVFGDLTRPFAAHKKLGEADEAARLHQPAAIRLSPVS